MTKEIRLIVRLIALWIIFVGSLWFLFWSVQQFTTSVVKSINHGYDTYYGYYPNSYNNYCLQAPAYPSTPVQPGMYQTKEEQVALDKYNQDLEKYNSDSNAACREDLEKSKKSQQQQEESQKNQSKAQSMSDMTTYGVLSLLSLLAAIVSLKAIRKSEEAQETV